MVQRPITMLARCLPLAAGMIAGLAGCAAGQARPATSPDTREWIQLFNGRDLDGWQIKFAGAPLGTNIHDTFRVDSGRMMVRYDKWPGFHGEFGHIFYKDPFSYYLVAAEYRFVGNQVRGAGPDLAWAVRNNGIMVHSQSAESMGLDQDFPMSLEVQLLGGVGRGPRSTANLCTPGTDVHFGDSLVTEHCINSKSKTYDGDQWVRVEAIVHGDELIQYVVEGTVVLEYTRPQIGGGNVAPVDPAVKVDGTPLTGGYISIQAETAPIDFRKIELLNLEGCMDPKASNYKSYYVRSKPGACK